MRVLQLIDSLAAGGAERMAVSYANALSNRGFSALVSTRDQGPLLNEILPAVQYLHLNRKRKIDFDALSALESFCIQHNINVIHAHGTSYFFGVLLKLKLRHIRLVWHDHFGLRDQQTVLNNVLLWVCARYFWGIIAVNKALAAWSEDKLSVKRVIYLPNFTALNDADIQKPQLFGEDGKRIVYVANLREPKNHLLVVRAAIEIVQQFPDWTFHFVGKNYADHYAKELKKVIIESGLQNHVFIYGQRTDVRSILSACEIGLIASDYEGLPVALLEYGICSTAVVATAVGHIPDLISDSENGLLSAVGSQDEFASKVLTLIKDENLRNRLAGNLKRLILEGYSENAVIDSYLSWLNQ